MRQDFKTDKTKDDTMRRTLPPSVIHAFNREVNYYVESITDSIYDNMDVYSLIENMSENEMEDLVGWCLGSESENMIVIRYSNLGDGSKVEDLLRENNIEYRRL